METTYILTAEMDGDTFAWLDELRRQHFPPERNFLSAHLTLFHRLSSRQVDCLRSLEMPSGAVELRIDQVIFLGFGVAMRVRSPGLERLRKEAVARMGDELSRQDLQPWRPHVTIQNKATADSARRLFRMLEEGFSDRAGTSTALLVWEYLGGPWKLAERIGFGKTGRPSR